MVPSQNATSAIKISRHNAITAFLRFYTEKRVNSLLIKTDIYQLCDRNETKLSLKYRIALLAEKKI